MFLGFFVGRGRNAEGENSEAHFADEALGVAPGGLSDEESVVAEVVAPDATPESAPTDESKGLPSASITDSLTIAPAEEVAVASPRPDLVVAPPVSLEVPVVAPVASPEVPAVSEITPSRPQVSPAHILVEKTLSLDLA